MKTKVLLSAFKVFAFAIAFATVQFSHAQTSNTPRELNPEDIIKPGDDNPGNDDTTVFVGDTSALYTINHKMIDLKVFPNPCHTGILNVQSELTIPLSLFSLDGREIIRFLSNSKVSVSELPKGVYILQSKDERYRLKATKIVIH